MAVLAEDWQQGGFGLYIHWPFCEAKCPYCDFNSHVVRQIDQKRWLRAYLSELSFYRSQTGPRVLTSVFFGGGTPSLMEPEIVADILSHIRKLWPVANDLETTLEANPGSVEAGRFTAYRQGGVNRISMGVQALNDFDLKRLGRIHSVKEAYQAFDIARNTFERVSFDLIYARQNQSLQDWQIELKQALSLAIDHLSLYQLTIEDGTAFGDRYKLGKLRGLPEDDTAADMYLATQEICDAAGLNAYEVSNHAKSGSESRHNLIYWRYGDYVGIGPGAHGRLTLNGVKYATEAHMSPGLWLQKAEHNSAESLRDVVEPQDQASEFLMMGLRLAEGISRPRFQSLSHSDLNEETLGYLSEIGMITFDKTRVTATPQGRTVLNAVLRELLVQ